MTETAPAIHAAETRRIFMRFARPAIHAVLGLAMASGCLLPLPSRPALAATPDQFVARTTADFVALCQADPASENYVAAIHFCHGFATGAYQYYLSLAGPSADHRFVCPPDPPPSRSQVIAEFSSWAEQHAEYMGEPPVETIFRFLGQRFPCSQSNTLSSEERRHS